MRCFVLRESAAAFNSSIASSARPLPPSYLRSAPPSAGFPPQQFHRERNRLVRMTTASGGSAYLEIAFPGGVISARMFTSSCYHRYFTRSSETGKPT